MSEALPRSGSMPTTCLYPTNPTIVCMDFRIPNGTHFLYLPQGKAEIVFMDYLQDLHCIMQWPLWNSPTPSMTHPLSFCIIESPGKGMGMFAGQLIKASELIMMEQPVVVVNRKLP